MAVVMEDCFEYEMFAAVLAHKNNRLRHIAFGEHGTYSGRCAITKKNTCIIIGGETENVSPFSLSTANLHDRLLCKLLLLGYTELLIGVTIYQGADRSGHHGRYLIGPRNFHQVNMASP